MNAHEIFMDEIIKVATNGAESSPFGLPPKAPWLERHFGHIAGFVRRAGKRLPPESRATLSPATSGAVREAFQSASQTVPAGRWKSALGPLTRLQASLMQTGLR